MKWAALALLGIVLAAAASYGASELATQPIGLESEPITAGDQLAPSATPTPSPKARRTPKPRRTRTPEPTAPPATPVPTAPPATPVPTVDDDNSGHGGGGDDSGRGDNSGRDHPEDD